MYLAANASGGSRIANAFGTAYDPVFITTLESQIGKCEYDVTEYQLSEGFTCPKMPRDTALNGSPA